MTRTQTLIAAVALVGTLAAGAAQAGGADVRWSVTIGSPVLPVYGAPVVVQPVPQPVYVAPYASPYVVYAPAPRWDRPAVVYRHDHRHPSRWDADGDGIPNRYDRVYNPRWDRDGDGIPNRRDPYPDYPRRGGWGR